MGSRRGGYPGGEFVVFKREAAKTNDFCCICDYRARLGLQPWNSSRMFHEGEQIAFIRFAGTSDSWDRAHSACATRELEWQHPISPNEGPMPRARVTKLQQYEGRRKYQLLIDHGSESWEVTRFSVRDEAIGAARLLNGWDPSVKIQTLAVAQARALAAHNPARGV